MVLRGNNLEMKLGLVFLSNPHSSQLQMTKCYPCSKEGQYTYSNQLTKLETIILWFFGKLCNLRQWWHNCATFHIDLHPPTHVQLKVPVVDVWDMLFLSVMQNFRSSWESFAHKDQQQTCLGYAAHKLWRWQILSKHLWIGFTINHLRAHYHIWNFNPK